jgi:hypothetical protein
MRPASDGRSLSWGSIAGSTGCGAPDSARELGICEILAEIFLAYSQRIHGISMFDG